MILRPVVTDDFGRMLAWREREEQEVWGRKWVTADSYRGWFSARVDNPLVNVWIAEDGGAAVGQVRVDSNGELSFSVDPVFRGRGYGSEMVRFAVAVSDPATVGGHLKANAARANRTSVRVLEKAGFVEQPGFSFFRR